MAHHLQTAANGTPDAILPLKRKKTDSTISEARSGLLAKEAVKHALKEYLDIKLAVKHYVDKHHIVDGISTDSSDEPEESPYPDPWGIPNAYHIFYLRQGGLPDWRRARAIATAKEYHAQQKSNFLGYQVNFNLNYEEEFGSYLNTHVNNIGDPFQEGNLTVNSKFMERAVLDYYAALWHAKWPHSDTDLDSYWGFTLTMGSTEGNLYGMWNARDYLSGKKILVDTNAWTSKKGKRVKLPPRLLYHQASTPIESPFAYTPIAFFSEDSHYSISKCMTMLEIRTFYAEGREKYPNQCPITDDGDWPAEVPSDDGGAMNIHDLASLVDFFAYRGYPIMVCFNYGTTFKGAYDDVALACEKLQPILEKYGLFERKVSWQDDNGTTHNDTRTGFWFHVDGALGAAYMPYIEMAYCGGLVDKKGPIFDFRLPMVHSIAMSGHKWIGSPAPCGLYMTKTKYQMNPPEIPEYIGTPDTTFAGSRNGLSAILLWDNIARHSYDDQIRKSLHLENMAIYTESSLRNLQEEVLKEDLYVARTPLALTVRFKRANDDLCKKYSLSNEDLEGKRYSHVFMMEHVTTELVDALVEDLSKEGAFAPDDTVAQAKAAAMVEAALRAPTSNRLSLVPTRGRGFHG
ncbi:hypothetical protein GOP47_0004287 [Adiantum capillus-veneris]|uniref:Histidine decarboxylase n=1 Tax=Adiantum capillus-veneris TaxID=13818 RepID=A0A9D4V7A4_ADICA|nr:hypothetical protein GOP47_0004287 [Adiantum capillus-veneris]